MKFYDTSGKQHSVDIRPSRWSVKDSNSSRSKFQSTVGKVIQELFPAYHVLEEFPCIGEKLYLDFFLPTKKLAIEVQGRQHDSFNPFFHKDKSAFAKQQQNDARKEKWCEINGIKLIKIRWGDDENEIKLILSNL